MTTVRHITACRFCGGALSIPFCDLGVTPLSNAYVDVADAAAPDPMFPLNAMVCEHCHLVQLDHIVDATDIFSDYAYFSSYSSSWLAHAAQFARAATARQALGPRSFVVELASNDGYLLRNFVDAGIPCLGVEPAVNVAEAALAAGVPTLVEFFGRNCAARIVAARGHADLVIANNVLAHVPDVNDFVAGMAMLAGPSGVVSIEVPHLLALVVGTQFDTIYHEHYAYWSLHSMTQVLEAHGLRVFRVEVLPTHGTSLRVMASADPDATSRFGSDALAAVRLREASAGVDRPDFYRGFGSRVRSIVAGLRSHLAEARTAGRTVAAYGAAAKGNTLLNASGVTAADIGMVADRNPAKQGKLLPGSRIPIVTPEALLAAQPDEVLILPWNLASEIAGELCASGDWSGRLLIAVPELRMVSICA